MTYGTGLNLVCGLDRSVFQVYCLQLCRLYSSVFNVLSTVKLLK